MTTDTDTHGDSPCDGDRPLRPVRVGIRVNAVRRCSAQEAM
ncbi:hypothetical protein L810_0107 [Burkholderia sp. AU4i]|nr:hypothetical protein L810_0107 [Burkholderia sp. AU4i]MDW9245955.1 hypothetical protein [Burkholderia cepacia]QOH36515.1 hypothetical protein C7S14_7805 [Burkholderia cepacia]